MKYDLVIPLANKDINKLALLLYSCLNYLVPQPESIVVVSEMDSLRVEGPNNGVPIRCIFEGELFPHIDFSTIDYRRKGWILQQFIKLFQNVSTENLYMVVDADLIFNRIFEVFPSDMKCLWLGRDQNHTPYYNLMEKFWGIGREYPHSFISELMMFNKDITRELLIPFDNSPKKLFEELKKLVKYTGSDFLLGDYEIYGNWVIKHHKDEYVIKTIKSKLFGMYSEWRNEDLLSTIESVKNEDIDIITMHSWE